MSELLKDALARLAGASVVVTGASGFIGQHVVAALASHGANVLGLSLFPGEPLRRGSVTLVGCDVTDERTVELAWDHFVGQHGRPVEYVIHLAGEKSGAIAKREPEHALRTGLLGALNLLRMARRTPGLRKVVLISSIAVYGPRHDTDETPLSESCSLGADTIYTVSKLTPEYVGLSYFHEFAVPVVIARLSNVFGPGQSEEALIPSLIAQMCRSNEVKVGSSSPVRDFIYVEDVVGALLALATCDQAVGRAVNVGTGVGHSVSAVIASAARAVGFRGTVHTEDARVRTGEKSVVVANPALLQSLTGWTPTIGFEAAMEKTAQSTKAGGHQ